jgi:hypothetical protein
MDSPDDFLFLLEQVADRHNPFYEGEYVVIQTSPRTRRLRHIFRSDDGVTAKNYGDLENLAHDYSSFALRRCQNGKLWHVDGAGEVTGLSTQQRWEWHSDFNTVPWHDEEDSTPGDITIHGCSYPFLVTIGVDTDPDPTERWQALSCVQGDAYRPLDYCPNCGYPLLPDIDEEEERDADADRMDVPSMCAGCRYYHGDSYGDHALVCGIHPYGWEGEWCPDFAAEDSV